MAKYEFDDYNGKIGRLYVNGKRLFVGLNDELANDVRRIGLELKIKVNNYDGWLTNDSAAHIREVDEDNKRENPIFCYIFEKLSSKHKINEVSFFTGWTSATSDDFVITDIQSIIDYYERIL